MSARRDLYGYADVGRYGLGHGLLAWARCIVWCDRVGATPLAPRWLRVRIGPYLRRERDKRFYFKLFRSGQQGSALRRLLLLATRTTHNINDVPGGSVDALARGTVVLFTNVNANNEQRYFHEVIGKAPLIRAALTDMTRARYRPEIISTPHIAIHVRGGDFGAAATVDQLTTGVHNSRLPLSWFAAMLGGVRDRIGMEAPAIIYSDCSDAEIADLLAMPNVQRSTYRESVTDMLAMAQAAIAISSGSGFSRWGAFLGDVPRICFPGQRHMRVFGDTNDRVDYEPEAMTADDLSADFIKLCAARLAGNANGTEAGNA